MENIIFSIYSLMEGKSSITVSGTPFRLVPLRRADFDFFWKDGIDGIRSEVPAGTAVRLFNECRQYGGCVAIVGVDSELYGTLWLTQRILGYQDFDLRLALKKEYAACIYTIFNAVVARMRDMGYDNITLFSQACDNAEVYGLEACGFTPCNASGLYAWRSYEHPGSGDSASVDLAAMNLN